MTGCKIRTIPLAYLTKTQEKKFLMKKVIRSNVVHLHGLDLWCISYIGLVFLFILPPLTGFSQIAFSFRYLDYRQSSWSENLSSYYPKESIANELALFENGFSVSLQYRVPLKNVRIECFPGLYLESAERTLLPEALSNYSTQFSIQNAGVSFDILIYLFDLAGECDCPVFSKSDPFFKKGFHLIVGGSYSRFELQHGQGQENKEVIDYSPGIFAGTGLDIGLSERITLTPHGGFKFHQSVNWQGLNPPTQQTTQTMDVEENNSSWQFGLRLMYKFTN